MCIQWQTRLFPVLGHCQDKSYKFILNTSKLSVSFSSKLYKQMLFMLLTHLKGLSHQILWGLFWHVWIGLAQERNLYFFLNFYVTPSIFGCLFLFESFETQKPGATVSLNGNTGLLYLSIGPTRRSSLVWSVSSRTSLASPAFPE